MVRVRLATHHTRATTHLVAAQLGKLSTDIWEAVIRSGNVWGRLAGSVPAISVSPDLFRASLLI